MVTLPKIDPIDFLVHRKFPHPHQRYGYRTGYVRGVVFPSRALPGDKDEWSKEREQYRIELGSMPPEELQALVDLENEKVNAEWKAKSDYEENQRVFNKPYALADFDYWSRMAHWTLDEALALSFGKAPEMVSWKVVQPHTQVSQFARNYARRRELAVRALQWKQLYDPVLPGIFITWAKRTQIEFPPELEAAVVANGHVIEDWKSLYDKLCASIDERIAPWKEAATKQADAFNDIVVHRDALLAQIEGLNGECTHLRGELEALKSQRAIPAEAKPLSTRERDSLLKLVIGMAVKGYSFQPRAARSHVPSEIAGDLEQLGIRLDVDTVRKYLKEGAELLPPDAVGKD
jgi:hypothetical protein